MRGQPAIVNDVEGNQVGTRSARRALATRRQMASRAVRNGVDVTPPWHPRRAPKMRCNDVQGTKGGVGAVGAAMRYSVLDVETTGLRVDDRVVEVAVLEVSSRGQVLSVFESVLNPDRHPGPAWLHALTIEECRAAPRFREVARALHDRLVGTVLVAHNLGFDWRFLREEWRRCGVTFLHEPAGLCTAQASRRLGVPASLEAACAFLRLPQRPDHSARVDAEATCALWVALRALGACRPVQPLRAGIGLHRLPGSSPPRPRFRAATNHVLPRGVAS